jgi:hypothetical protein
VKTKVEVVGEASFSVPVSLSKDYVDASGIELQPLPQECGCLII